MEIVNPLAKTLVVLLPYLAAMVMVYWYFYNNYDKEK